MKSTENKLVQNS